MAEKIERTNYSSTGRRDARVQERTVRVPRAYVVAQVHRNTLKMWWGTMPLLLSCSHKARVFLLFQEASPTLRRLVAFLAAGV